MPLGKYRLVHDGYWELLLYLGSFHWTKTMITLSKHILFSFILCLLFSQSQGQSGPNKGFLKIKNDIFWDTQEGDPLYSQGGGIFSFKDPKDGQTKYF